MNTRTLICSPLFTNPLSQLIFTFTIPYEQQHPQQHPQHLGLQIYCFYIKPNGLLGIYKTVKTFS